jgi:hypothetical protein
MAYSLSKEKFVLYFEMTLLRIGYKPNEKYSVFTQYDKEYYLGQKEKFFYKYRCFSALGSVLKPKHLIELGVCAGSGAHAYLFESKNTFYSGYDLFNPIKTIDGIWDGFDIANKLLQEENIKYKLYKTNLRDLNVLPQADVVVVDADHSYYHAFEDCLLAKTSNPEYIFIDDLAGEEVQQAVAVFLKNHIEIEWMHEINYVGKGLLLKIKK